MLFKLFFTFFCHFERRMFICINFCTVLLAVTRDLIRGFCRWTGYWYKSRIKSGMTVIGLAVKEGI